MDKPKIIIAIDGYSSTGKSTVARQIAKSLEYVYIDTGAMYRAVTLYALRKRYVSKEYFNQEAIERFLPFVLINFEINRKTGLAEVHLNGENVEKEIRKMLVSNHVSQIAAISEVRKKLVEQQKLMGKNKGIVMDGRDIGTVVFPEAELKIFMTATAKDRAERRFKELTERGEEVTYEEVLKNVVDRDHLDSTREDSPLKRADDAIVIDNSNLTLEEQYHKILALAREVIASVIS